ncbi:hypothetical protein [Roseimicrobium sp. ORNL1]|uniref:hypothetical protein n=1 Tax=Roseimicrobium sp. ORNL1 TaxID=2711231 RepID=UPI0013E107F2|nr:hypothetical protein [Roseimicrobium sp. ORNL1]QIF02074.1 hypothetical protein G5S37_11200 [Roseimicrobium sp. ORNL1]
MKFILPMIFKFTSTLSLAALLVTSCTSSSTSTSTSTPTPTPSSSSASSSPPTWSGDAVPRKAGTIRLGNSKQPSWGWADVPVNVVELAQTRLKPPASSWDVSHHWHDERNTIDVVLLRDEHWNACLFTRTRGKWTLMEGEQGLRQISLMEQESLKKLPSLPVADLKPLCGSIAYLHARPDRYVLQSSERYAEHWLRGGEVKDLSVLKKYCVDPKVVQEGDEYVITCHAITRKGSLEHWKTRVRRQNGRSEIVDITIREVMKKGSFSWALVP